MVLIHEIHKKKIFHDDLAVAFPIVFKNNLDLWTEFQTFLPCNCSHLIPAEFKSKSLVENEDSSGPRGSRALGQNGENIVRGCTPALPCCAELASMP